MTLRQVAGVTRKEVAALCGGKELNPADAVRACFPLRQDWQHGGPLGRRGRVLPGFASIRRSTSRSLRVVVFVVGILPHCRQLLEQLRQPFLHRLPHYIEVDLEIAVSHAIAHDSYRLRLREHLVPELRRQVAGGQQIDINTEQRFQFVFQIAQVQQRGAGQRIDQQIEVAVIPVSAMQHRTEDARFAVRKRLTTSRTALRFKSSTTDGRIGILSYRNSLRWNESLLSPRWSHSSRSRLTGAAASTPAARSRRSRCAWARPIG